MSEYRNIAYHDFFYGKNKCVGNFGECVGLADRSVCHDLWVCKCLVVCHLAARTIATNRDDIGTVYLYSF